MANINSHWKRLMSLGCTHGHLGDPELLDSAIEFKELWKPHSTVHHGDAWDTAPFRSGAHGTPDEGVSIASDHGAGLDFIGRLRPDWLLNGNHDIRLWKNANHHNAIIADCAQGLIADIRKLVKSIRCKHIESYDIRKSFIQISDLTLFHGWMYGEQALRDHAEHFGRSIMAHLHVPGTTFGRRVDRPQIWCVGTLGDIEKMEYANARRATARWGAAIVVGEYNDKESRICLINADANKKFHLPQKLV